MSAFGRYARWYDALYRDKDYEAEVDFLEAMFGRLARRRVRTVLDLGCGTGGHALVLARRGYAVSGVDRSPGMLRIARNKAGAAGLAVGFERGDLRSVRLGRRFDAVIAMFAVLGYQTADEDVLAALATAAAHLAPGGLLVFDVWFGPAVLADPPHDRTKRVSEGGLHIVRRTRCETDLVSQVVSVRFSTEARARGRAPERCDEEHRMRFFFPRELALLLESAGLRLRLLAPFLEPDREPGAGDWNVTVVAERPAQRRASARRTTSR